jgi:hypothetical protein
VHICGDDKFRADVVAGHELGGALDGGRETMGEPLLSRGAAHGDGPDAVAGLDELGGAEPLVKHLAVHLVLELGERLMPNGIRGRLDSERGRLRGRT